MKLTGLFTAVCLVFGSLALSAQDLHFTLYDYAPLSINPANAGNYEGSYRIGGIYRDQWSAVSSGTNAFRTPMIYIDAPLVSVGKKGHWIGAGLNVQLDESGTLDQKTNTYMLAASFNYVIDRRKQTVLSLGVQGGRRERSIEVGQARPEDWYTSGTMTTDDDLLMSQGANDDPNASGFLINSGISLKTNINKKTSFHIGAAALNINRPNQSLGQADSDSKNDEFRLPFRINFHTGLSSQLNKKWTLNPTLLVSTIRNQNEVNLQVWADYLFNKEKEIDLRFGLGHRLGRDLQPLLGVNYGALRAAVGYDIRLGGLSDALNARGGVEIAVSYTGLIFKKPDVPPVIFCPQL